MNAYGRVLITGGSGYLGHELTRQLLEQASVDAVCIYSRSEWRQAQLYEHFGGHPKLRMFIGDVRDLDRLRRAMHGVDLVIHAAALKRVEVGQYNPTEMVSTNVTGTVNALLAAEEERVQRFVLVSSDKAYQPANAYGASKFLAECVALGDRDMRGLRRPKVRVVRYGNVAGSTGSVIPVWRSALERGRRARVTDPDATRFWMTRQEAAKLVLSAATLHDAPDLMIPELPAFRLGDLAEAMGLHNADVVGLQPGEKLHESMSENACSLNAVRLTIEQLREGLKEC